MFEIVNEVLNQRILWETLQGPILENTGSVWWNLSLLPGGRGAIVRVQMDFGQPGRV